MYSDQLLVTTRVYKAFATFGLPWRLRVAHWARYDTPRRRTGRARAVVLLWEDEYPDPGYRRVLAPLLSGLSVTVRLGT